jgi:ubiquinone/menaquinone biosynthesis C-methylase UbiE
MPRDRASETVQGIQGTLTVEIYDQMQRRFRDKGWIETKAIIQNGITEGTALEVGPGPGYLGLEWLKHTDGTRLTGLDISPDMISVARRNAAEYGFTERTEYVESTGEMMPFDDNEFEASFSNGSLHEWADVPKTLCEIWRVLKPGGRLFVSDLRRDMLAPVKWFMWLVTKPKEIRPGLITSIHAAYTRPEVKALMDESRFKDFTVSCNPMGLQVVARKEMGFACKTLPAYRRVAAPEADPDRYA